MYISNRPRTSVRRKGFPFRRLLLFVVTVVVVVVGVGLYENRELVAPMVDRAVNDLFESGQDLMRTAQAPTLVPTQDPSDNIRLANQAWTIGSYGEATRLYADVTDALPTDVTAHSRLALGLIMQGRYDAALAAAEDAVTANPFHPDAWTMQAMALNRVERYHESIASALHAIELVSLQATARGVNETDESGDAAVRQELKAMRARARAYLAESYADLGNFNRGFDEVTRALEDDPESYDALFIRGFINRAFYYDAEEARADFQQAYEKSVEMPHIGFNLALVDLYDPNNPERVNEAVQVLNQIVERNPENIPALYELGRHWWRQGGDRAQGMTYLQRCVNADPEYVDCLYELGRVQEDEESYDLALPNFERTIELGSTNPYHFYWAGAIQRDNCPRAIDYWQRGMPLAQQLQVDSPTDPRWPPLIVNFQEALSGCGVLSPTIVPEVTDEPSS